MKKGQKSISFKMVVLASKECINTKGPNFHEIEIAGPQYPFTTDDPRYGTLILNGELLLNAPTSEVAKLFPVGMECRFSLTPLPEPTALANSGLLLKKNRKAPKGKPSVAKPLKTGDGLCAKHPKYTGQRKPRANCPQCVRIYQLATAEGTK